jgi:molecular chaperone DnaK (HSP70)
MENVFSESEVDVFGGHLSLDKCCELGRAELSFGKNDDGSPRTLPAGTAITVSFKLEEDGCLKVTGKESNTNAEVEVEFKGEGIISQAEMDSQKRTLEETKLSD